jgi:myo-inositol-1(or 4)-monophosphatase
VKYDRELAFAEELAREAGAIIKRHLHADNDFALKSDTSPVTVVDTEINELVATRIREEFPGHVLKGEEQSFGEVTARHVWLCDPIDGTVPFMLGIPACCFMLAFFVDGVPQVAVTYNPGLDDLYVAVRGHGALHNGKAMHVQDAGAADHPIIVMDPKILRESSDFVAALEKAGFQIALPAGTGEKIMLVAKGRSAGMARTCGDAHDIGVGAFIVEEAGGKVTSFDGGLLLDDRFNLRNGYIIASPKAHAAILAIAREYRA